MWSIGHSTHNFVTVWFKAYKEQTSILQNRALQMMLASTSSCSVPWIKNLDPKVHLQLL